MLHRNILNILSPSCFAVCGHHLPPRIAIVFSILPTCTKLLHVTFVNFPHPLLLKHIPFLLVYSTISHYVSSTLIWRGWEAFHVIPDTTEIQNAFDTIYRRSIMPCIKLPVPTLYVHSRFSRPERSPQTGINQGLNNKTKGGRIICARCHRGMEKSETRSIRFKKKNLRSDVSTCPKTLDAASDTLFIETVRHTTEVLRSVSP